LYVYPETIHDIHPLRQTIYGAAATITLDTRNHTWDKNKYCLDVCKATNAAHTEILISGFRRDVDEICGLLGYYTASCGNYLPTFDP
jgi:hypothetical protein